MKSTYTVKLRKDGSILVPKALRMLYGVKHGTAFNVEVGEDNITYHPARMVCPVCGEAFQKSRNLLTDQICPRCDEDAAAMIRAGQVSSVTQAIKLLKEHKASIKPNRRKAAAKTK